jgi:two-component system, LytTR family, sensor kinase
VNDTWLRILLVAVPCALFLYDYGMDSSDARLANIIYFLTVLFVCEGSRALIYRSRTWFKGPHKKHHRLFALIPSGIAWVSVLFIAGKAWRNHIAIGGSGMGMSMGFTLHLNDKQVQLGLVGASIVYAVLTFLVLLWINNLVYHYARLRYTEKERDRLEKEKLQAELQQLKGIVNPHFLFNNLNSLSALISESPVQAEEFLDELTKVFRYLLRTNESDLVTLDQELQFLDSYCHLLQTRYGGAISMRVDINPECRSLLLPPLTLQLLVENAVKHNRLLKEAPLRIELFSEAHNRLVVRNNLSPREQKLESTGIGLRNIHSRYALLGQEAPVVRREASHFAVVIPLIHSGPVPQPAPLVPAF